MEAQQIHKVSAERLGTNSFGWQNHLATPDRGTASKQRIKNWRHRGSGFSGPSFVCCQARGKQLGMKMELGGVCDPEYWAKHDNLLAWS